MRKAAGATCTLQIKSSTASMDAIQRAAYRMSNLISLDLERVDDHWICNLRSRDGNLVPDDLVETFRVHVLDYTLRERIRFETEPIRHAVLALAFSELGPARQSQGDD
jgi:His-Xaa-Ser system protein HxsD